MKSCGCLGQNRLALWGTWIGSAFEPIIREGRWGVIALCNRL